MYIQVVNDKVVGISQLPQPSIEGFRPATEQDSDIIQDYYDMLTASIKKSEKQRAYQSESDPVFFKWQRGEATETQWLEKVAEINLRFA